LACGQTFAPMGDLKFDAGTFKPSKPGARGGGWVHPEPGGRRYIGAAMSLRDYLWVAYQVKPEQIVGGPDWMDSEPFDLNAEAEHSSSLVDLHIMLQNLLTEQFKLKFHFEKKEMRAYTLTVAKDGPKNLKAREHATGGDVFLDGVTERPAHAKWTAHCASMDFFAWRLSQIFDHPVINQTGVPGCLDFELKYTQNLPSGILDGQIVDAEPVDTFGPTIYEALEQQLGLKLTEERHVPVETMVIDHAERPAAE
jgi:uncharacterized protein (TIGR03435 family)